MLSCFGAPSLALQGEGRPGSQQKQLHQTSPGVRKNKPCRPPTFGLVGGLGTFQTSDSFTSVKRRIQVWAAQWCW